jgi:hypothetical protein
MLIRKAFMKPTAISFANFCTAGQKRNTTIARKVKESRLWCSTNGYQLEETGPDTGVLELVTSSRAYLACLQLLHARLQNGSIAPGTALILDSLGYFGDEDLKSALSLLMASAQQGLLIVTPRDNKIWDASAMNDMGGFFISVCTMYALDRERVVMAMRRAAGNEYRARQAALQAEEKAA